MNGMTEGVEAMETMARGDEGGGSGPGALPPAGMVDWRQCLPPPQLHRAHSELVSQNAEPHDAFFLREGVVKLVRSDDRSRERVLGLGYPGSFVGAASVILGRPHAVAAVTVTRCAVQRVPAERLRELIRSNGELSWDMQKVLSREVLAQAEMLIQLGSLSTRARLELLLRQAVGREQGGDPEAAKDVSLRLPLRYAEVAALLAVTPEHLSRLLKKLQDEGVIRLKGRRLTVSDVGRLNGGGPPPAVPPKRRTLRG